MSRERCTMRIAAAAGVAALLLSGPVAQAGEDAVGVLRVCADPNNLPFSNQAGQGFENRIVALVARALGEKVEYTWWPQRRGFLRNTLNAGRCDLVAGMPAGVDQAATTHAYYRSSYVAVARRDSGIRIDSFDDPQLRSLRVGVQMIGDDGASSPPAHALSRRGIIDNVVGYSVYGDYREPNPPSRIIEAVADGEIDVALAWGPLAGYFARQSKVPLSVTPLQVESDPTHLPFAFDIAMAVRRDDPALRDAIDGVLQRKRAEIESILDEYGVPRAPLSIAEAPQ